MPTLTVDRCCEQHGVGSSGGAAAPVGPLLAEGSVLSERGDFAEALTKFEAVLRAEPVTPPRPLS